jgi:hypothetical protein
VVIKINLADLTDEKIEEAIAAGRSHCQYKAPCIIGTLMTCADRRVADRGGDNGTTIGELTDENIVAFPDKRQARAAISLQAKFDNSSEVSDAEVRRYARKLRERFSA